MAVLVGNTWRKWQDNIKADLKEYGGGLSTEFT